MSNILFNETPSTSGMFTIMARYAHQGNGLIRNDPYPRVSRIFSISSPTLKGTKSTDEDLEIE